MSGDVAARTRRQGPAVRRVLCWIAWLVVLPIPVGAVTAPPRLASPLAIDPTAQQQSPDGHVDVLLDAAGTLRLEDVLAAPERWAWAGPASYTRPLTHDVLWLRLRLHNPSPSALARLVEVAFPLIDSVDAWLLEGPVVLGHYRLGEDSELADRPTGHLLPRVPVDLPAGGERTVVFRMTDEAILPAPLLVGTTSALEYNENQRLLQVGVFAGLFLLGFLFAAYLFVRLRGAAFGWLAVTLGSALLVLALYTWGGLALWFPAPQRAWLVNRGILWSLGLVVAALVHFSVELLGLRTWTPRLARVLVCLTYVFVPLGLLVGNVIPVLAAAIAAFPLCGFVTVAIGGASLRRALAGDRVARVFTAAFSLFFAAAVVTTARAWGLLPTSYFTENTTALGLACLLVGMSVAVADQFAEEQRARRLALEAQLAEAHRNARLSAAFERFVPKQFLDRLGHADMAAIALGDCVEREMSVLFSDIRDFTTLVERMTPAENLSFVNDFLGYMEPAIHDNGGFIDKYIGDAVMALFDGAAAGAESSQAGALPAVTAAVAMHRALQRYNEEHLHTGRAPLAIGVGVHTGRLMLGTVGGRDRLNASVIGDAVNLAARVESLTKRYGARLLVTEQTVECLGTHHGFALRVVDRVRVKGKREPTALFEVVDAEAPAEQAAWSAIAVRYHAGWAAYQDGQFQAALADFEACLAVHRTDRPSVLLAERCRELLTQGVTSAWDSAVTLVEK